jgi:soluble lytic murein transglycosylase-like protein
VFDKSTSGDSETILAAKGYVWQYAWTAVVSCALQFPTAASATGDAPPFTTPSEQCIVPASTYHTVNPYVLRSILSVESGLKSSALGKNRNGSVDIGIGQINSIHLKELAKFGIGPTHLQDACIGTYVAAWHLKKAIAERGNTWEGVASYHSRTPYFNKRYQALLLNELIRSGAMQGQLVPVPPLNPSEAGAGGPGKGLKAAPADDSQAASVIVFDSRQ